MKVPLIPKATLQTEKAEAAAQSYFRSRSDYYKYGDDSDEALKYHLLFSSREVLQEAGLDYVTDDVALYNAYYWFLVCAKRCQARDGVDVGFEDQAFMILKYATCDLDFTIVEEVSRLAEKDALEH